MVKVADKNKVLNVINDFFKQFQIWFNRSSGAPSTTDFEKCFSKNLQMFDNGQLVIRGAANYADRLQKFQKKYSDFKISEPLEEPLVCGNQAVFYYRLDLTTHNGQHKQVYIMGLFTIEDDKISRWVEVTHEKDSENWSA